MNTTQELSIGKDQNITFKKWFHHETKLPTGEWFTSIPIKRLDIEYSFYKTIFKKWNSDEIVIDWEIVKRIADTVLENIDTLLQKSETLLIALHKEIFGNEYEEHQGYFEFSAIEIVKSWDGRYEFDLKFWLDSHTSYVLDPYFAYYVRFKHINYTTLTVVGIRRE